MRSIRTVWRAVGQLSQPVIRRTGQVPRVQRVITSYHDIVPRTTQEARLLLGWVTVNHLGMYSTQPFIPPGKVNRIPGVLSGWS